MQRKIKNGKIVPLTQTEREQHTADWNNWKPGESKGRSPFTTFTPRASNGFPILPDGSSIDMEKLNDEIERGGGVWSPPA